MLTLLLIEHVETCLFKVKYSLTVQLLKTHSDLSLILIVPFALDL